MRYQYVVILKKSSERTTDLLSILLCLLSAIGFLLGAMNTLFKELNSGAYPYFMSGAAFLLLAGLVINLVAKRRNRHSRVRYRYLLIIAAIGWMGMTSAPWVGILLFLAAFLEYQAKRPLEIGFHHDRVVINSLFRKKFDWTSFNQIMLKDGLLTLDFKNNRLLQKEVDEEEDGDADEEEFNDYCREMLETVHGETVHGGTVHGGTE